MSTSKLAEVCLKFSSFLLWRLRDEHKTPSTENFFEDNCLSGIIICSDSSLLPWKIFTRMLMAFAFCSVWIYSCISRYKVRTVLLLMCFVIHLFPISKRLNERRPFIAGRLCIFMHIYGLIGFSLDAKP